MISGGLEKTFDEFKSKTNVQKEVRSVQRRESKRDADQKRERKGGERKNRKGRIVGCREPIPNVFLLDREKGPMQFLLFSRKSPTNKHTHTKKETRE